jgi:hypothetical protein
MPRGKSYFLQGQQGGIVLNSTNTSGGLDGNWRVITAIENSEFDAVSDLIPTLIDNPVSLKKGQSLSANVKQISVTSGTVIAYYD